ncbi:HGGxSTG domain-containing protein [Microvirgula aerodenitrificans]|uniref:HGGxSTG domain-containing protein n=1 Tax=Microvirgula aerodenitrificans TaxID=57480 RepID=UPI00048BCAC1|nr:HGGxSTG domain-containing protein [Microvirgula aerodenitrificans]
MALCGAKTRSGEPCKRHSVPGSTRCKLHGGKSPGAAKGNRYAARPGSLYSRFLSDEEQGIAASIELGNVDEELRLTRIRLMRALQREQDKGDTLEVESETTEPVEIDGEPTGGDLIKRTAKVRDYSALIDKLTARVESLEARRVALVAAALDAEIKQLEIEKRRAELKDPDDDIPSPVKVVVEVRDARKPHA